MRIRHTLVTIWVLEATNRDMFVHSAPGRKLKAGGSLLLPALRQSQLSGCQTAAGSMAAALFVTAHPDDETMFFSPSILNLVDRGMQVALLCLSTGAHGRQWSGCWWRQAETGTLQSPCCRCFSCLDGSHMLALCR